MVPSTNRKEYSWESSGSLPYGTGALFPTQNHTNILGWGSFGHQGTGKGQWEKGPPNKWSLAEEGCAKHYSSAQFTERLMHTYVPLDQPVNLHWFLNISCLSALLLITSHRKTALFFQTANKTCRLISALVKNGNLSPWENTTASLPFCMVMYLLCMAIAYRGQRHRATIPTNQLTSWQLPQETSLGHDSSSALKFQTQMQDNLHSSYSWRKENECVPKSCLRRISITCKPEIIFFASSISFSKWSCCSNSCSSHEFSKHDPRFPACHSGWKWDSISSGRKNNWMFLKAIHYIDRKDLHNTNCLLSIMSITYKLASRKLLQVLQGFIPHSSCKGNFPEYACIKDDQYPSPPLTLLYLLRFDDYLVAT